MIRGESSTKLMVPVHCVCPEPDGVFCHPDVPPVLQVLSKGGPKFKFEEANPFVSPGDEEELASCAYR